MSQLSLSSFDSVLMVRSARGRYQPASADQILEAARLVIDQKMPRGKSFTSPMAVKEYLGTKLACLEHEVFAVLFLDTQHRLIEYSELFRGTIDSASVYPREVLKEALRLNAAAVIISHNHPSGNPEPSAADKSLTKRLREALAMVDVRVLLLANGRESLQTRTSIRHPWSSYSRRMPARPGCWPRLIPMIKTTLSVCVIWAWESLNLAGSVCKSWRRCADASACWSNATYLFALRSG